MKTISRKVRAVFPAFAFLLILLVVFLAFCSVFRFKYNNGPYNLDIFYEQERNSIDVLILGSSHAFMNIHNGVLYDEFGMASYNIGGASQPLWNSYHYLVEALKTQTPCLVVLEGYKFTDDFEYGDAGRITNNTFGLRPSLNLIQALQASVPQEDFFEYFFRFFQYHGRYEGELSAQDFLPGQGNALYDDWKGYVPLYGTESRKTPEAIGEDGVAELHPKVETYYRKIIELCQSRNIPLHIVITPHSFDDLQGKRFNRAQEIAAEYGVSFTNYNTPERLSMLDFDFARDMGENNHLNYNSSIRFTHAFGEELTSLYDIPDRRGDARWASWARSSAYYRRDLDNYHLKQETQIDPYLASLAGDPDYTLIISVTGYCKDYYDQISSWLRPFGVQDMYFDYDMNGTWVLRNGKTVMRYSPDLQRPYLYLDNTVVTLNEGFYCTVDKRSAKRVDRGLNLVVYDHITRSVVDIIGFDAPDGFSAVR